MKSCAHVYRAAFAGLNTAADKIVTLQAKTNRMGAAGDLDAGGREQAGRDAVDEDFRPGRDSVHLSPGDVVVVPAGVPHWFKEVPTTINYYVVKVVKQ